MCTPNTLATLRPAAATCRHSMVVREDSLTLFGFADDDEKAVFELLQTASGVGPKLAQAMLAVLGPDDLRRAVATEDVKTLTQVPGIGQKGAQRIILELKDRLGAPVGRGRRRCRSRRSPLARPGAPGLLGLGWSAKEADKAPSTRWPTRPRRRHRARRRRAAACRAADAEPGMTVHHSTLPRSAPGADRLTAADADGDERVVEAALRPRTLTRSSARTGSASSSAWSSRPPGAAAGCPTTCCSPARPASARPRWR
jgi:Holliday junction DNA helicase RuvA